MDELAKQMNNKGKVAIMRVTRMHRICRKW